MNQVPQHEPRRSARTLAGVGLGLRWDFLEEALEARSGEVAFFEVSPENYLGRGGYYPASLARISERHPIVTHGLTLSIGAIAEPDAAYLTALKAEVTRFGSPWHSDHVCFSSSGARVLHELLPLKFSLENAIRVAERARRMEDFLERPFALENITYYVHPGKPELSELDFLNEVLSRSNARLLLDVNNAYVNASNHGFDAREFIAGLPLERVIEIHVAGHESLADGLLLDTHGARTSDPVLELLEWTLARTGDVPILLERDNRVPSLNELLSEVRALEAVRARALAQRAELHAASA